MKVAEKRGTARYNICLLYTSLSEKAIEEIEQQPGVMNEVRLYRNTFEDDHIACDWGDSYSIDNTDKYAYLLPDSLNLGWGKDKSYAALTTDNLPLGNVYGFSENLLNKIDIIEGENDLSVLKDKLWNGNTVILVGKYDDKGKDVYKRQGYGLYGNLG